MDKIRHVDGRVFQVVVLRPVTIIVWALLWGQITGCGYFYTLKGQYAGTSDMLARGDYQTALQQIEAAKHKAYQHKDRVLFYLDAGMLHHYAGHYEKSNEYLSEAERGIEENFTRSVSQAGASLMLNDNALSYDGEDYEDIYLNIFKALNYLHLQDEDGAFVEIRRADEKIKAMDSRYGELVDALNASRDEVPRFKPGKSQFRDSALDRWLSMLLYRTDRRLDEAKIDYDRIRSLWQLQPRIYPFKQPDFTSLFQPAPEGKSKLNLICFTGQGLDKTAASIYVHTERDTLIIGATEEMPSLREYPQLLQPIYWPGIEPGIHFKLQLPVLETQGSRVAAIEINIDGAESLILDRIESMERVAQESWRAKMPIILLKTITRATLKALASHAAKSGMRKQNDDRGSFVLLRVLLDLTVSATENADLRVSRFFPAEAFVGEVVISPGVHRVEIIYQDVHGNVLATELKLVTVKSGHLNLVESFCLN